MTDLPALLNDIATAIRACPEVMGEVSGNADAVSPYEDIAGVNNSLARAVYMQPNGTVLVAWTGTTLGGSDGTVQYWEHSVEIYVRALKQQSPLTLLNAVMDGTPGGEALRWRYLCVNGDVLPMQLIDISRVTDEEGIDYYVIRSSFKERGDTHYAMSGQ